MRVVGVPNGALLEEGTRDLRARVLIPWYVAIVGGAWAIVVPVFVRLTAPHVVTDIMAHAHLAQKFMESGHWFSYSLWYPLVYIGSFGAQSELALRLASIGLLSVLVAVKAAIVFWISVRVLKSPAFAAMVTFVLMVATPMVDPLNPADIYLGQVSVNVWHNSTNILAAPCVILAFYSAIRLLVAPSLKLAFVFTAFMLVSVLAKPNFAIAFLPVLGIATIFVLWKSAPSLKSGIAIVAIAFVPSTLVLLYQYLSVFGDNALVRTTLVFAPFEVWNAHSANIPLSLLLSLSGPIFLWLALPSKERVSTPMIVAWATLAFAILQMAFLGERTVDGLIAEDGNWFWGSYSALTIVFLTCLIKFAVLMRLGRHSPERVVGMFVALLAVAAHVASGLYYVLSVGVAGYPSF